MSAAVRRTIWCTTCAEYVRPGTHGIHAMRFTGGAEPVPDDDPQMSGAAAVALIVLVIAGTVAALFALAAWLACASK